MLRHIIHSLSLMFVAPVRLNWAWAAAGLAVSAGSAYMGYKGGKKAEKAQQDAAEYSAALNKQKFALQKEQIAAAVDEAQHKASTDLHDTSIAFMKQRSAIIAGAGEAGIAGGSVTRTLVDRIRSEQDIRGRQLTALESFMNKSDRDMVAASYGLAASATPYKGVSGATLALASGLNFASNALSIYSTHKQMEEG